MPAQAAEVAETDVLRPLLQAPARQFDPAAGAHSKAGPIAGVIVGELLAIVNESKAALVRFDGAPGAGAQRALSTVDLHGAHIGRRVVLMFEHGDPARPIVIGVLQGAAGWPADDKPEHVQLDADGQRLLVSAKEQLVLRCGRASITLTKAGKVLIEGSYLLSRSTGVNRIKGGSVQLN